MNCDQQWIFLPRCGIPVGALIGLLLFAALSVGAAGQEVWSWERYQPILDRAPFGKAASGTGALSAAELAALAAAEEAEQGPALADIVKLSVITRYADRPAAGFTDTSTGRTFYLFEGDSVEDYTLLLVDAPTATIWLRKGTQEAELILGAKPGAAADSTALRETTPARQPAAGARSRLEVSMGGNRPATNNDSQTKADSISYSALQRRRAEEAKRKDEETRRKAEEERKLQEERVAKLTGEALQKLLREYNLEMIKSGKSTTMPMELTLEEVEQLAAEGIDVSQPSANAPATSAATPTLRVNIEER